MVAFPSKCCSSKSNIGNVYTNYHVFKMKREKVHYVFKMRKKKLLD